MPSSQAAQATGTPPTLARPLTKAGVKGDATLDRPDGKTDLQRGITDKYAEIGGPVGHFGTPDGEQESGPDGGAFVTFPPGTSFWSPDTDAHSAAGWPSALRSRVCAVTHCPLLGSLLAGGRDPPHVGHSRFETG